MEVVSVSAETDDNPSDTGFLIGTQKRNFRIQFSKIEKNVSPSDNQNNPHSIFYQAEICTVSQHFITIERYRKDLRKSIKKQDELCLL
jgi:hypothetical protein